ncbi:phospholipase-like protein [Tanacetum coccineum]
MMNEVDVENLTIEQYLMLTQENQAQGIARTKSGMMITKDIENMTIAGYMEYEAEIKRDPWGYAQSYTRSSGSTTLERKKEEEDSSETLPCQLPPKEINPGSFTLPLTISNLKLYAMVDLGAGGISFVTKEEEEDSSETLPCQLPPKEINPGSFTLPCTIGNLKLYVIADLGAGVNVMPKSLFEHLKLANLKETSMVFEMVDMTKKAPLGIVENILVKIDKFLFHSDFIVIDMLEGLNETMLLGRPFLATIHAQIDVFRREILLGIGEEKVKFDMNGGICHSRVPFKNICMASAVQESENFNPLEIENDVFSYDSPTCLLLEQGTPSCSDESIDTVDSSDDMQELEGSQDDEVGSHLLRNEISRSLVCKPVRITFVDYHERQNVRGNGMIFADFLKVRYGNKNIDDGMDKQNFNFEVDFGRTRDDQYSRRFDVYKEEFDNEIKQLVNEYELKAGRKRCALDEVWEKCEKFHDTTRLWHDKGFEEEQYGKME